MPQFWGASLMCYLTILTQNPPLPCRSCPLSPCSWERSSARSSLNRLRSTWPAASRIPTAQRLSSSCCPRAPIQRWRSSSLRKTKASGAPSSTPSHSAKAKAQLPRAWFCKAKKTGPGWCCRIVIWLWAGWLLLKRFVKKWQRKIHIRSSVFGWRVIHRIKWVIGHRLNRICHRFHASVYSRTLWW